MSYLHNSALAITVFATFLILLRSYLLFLNRYQLLAILCSLWFSSFHSKIFIAPKLRPAPQCVNLMHRKIAYKHQFDVLDHYRSHHLSRSEYILLAGPPLWLYRLHIRKIVFCHHWQEVRSNSSPKHLISAQLPLFQRTPWVALKSFPSSWRTYRRRFQTFKVLQNYSITSSSSTDLLSVCETHKCHFFLSVLSRFR